MNQLVSIKQHNTASRRKTTYRGSKIGLRVGMFATYITKRRCFAGDYIRCQTGSCVFRFYFRFNKQRLMTCLQSTGEFDVDSSNKYTAEINSVQFCITGRRRDISRYFFFFCFFSSIFRRQGSLMSAALSECSPTIF